MPVSISNKDLNFVKIALAGKGYNLGKILNRGSFAVVAVADKKETKEKIAVKIIDKTKAPGDFVKKFLPKELEISLALKHKNVILTMDAMNLGYITCIFMEICDRGDLLGHICDNGVIEDAEAKKLFSEIIDGMSFIHSHSVSHRDLKCENILLDHSNTIKIADFGFARYVVDEKTKQRKLSETYCGSPSYAAPEVLRGTPYNPIMSDVWSLGVILYVMVNGIMPFDDSDHVRMVQNQMEKNWRFNPDRKGKISPQCRRIIRKMLEPDICIRLPTRKIQQCDWFKAAPESPSTNVLKQMVRGLSDS